MKQQALKNLADIQTGPFGSQLHKEDYVEKGTPIVTVEHLGERVFTEQNLPRVSDVDKKRLSKYILCTGDIVFSRVGSVDRCSFVDKAHNGWMFSGRCLRVRPYKDIDSLYLYYFFCLEKTKEFIRNIAVGANMASINTKLLGEVEIFYPDISVQRKIVEILSAIDSKIELNNRINDNLQQQVQLLYEDFITTIGETPMAMSEVIDVRDGTHDSPKPVEFGYPLVTSKHLFPFGVDVISPNKISESDYNKVNERSKVDANDILLSMIGTVGLVSLIIEDEINFAIKNVGLFKTSKCPQYTYYLLCYLKSKETAQHIEKCLAGSTQKYISLTELRKMPISIPNALDINKFNDLVTPLFSLIIENVKANKNLTAIRDSLLPKFMLGELDVTNIDF